MISISKNLIFFFSFLLLASQAYGQEVATRNKQQIDFNQKINKTLRFDVPFISVGELDKNFNDYVILDSRELEEYNVAHIKGARCVGYDDFEISNIGAINKDQKIAVYCSIGYRSEKVAKKLREAGYKNAVNVYGSIFQWVNDDKPVYDKDGREVSTVHTYNRRWSKWVLTEKVKKVW